MVKPAYVLVTQHFSEAMVARIRAATPAGWSIQEEEENVVASKLGCNVLFVLAGKDNQLKVRFAGGSSVGAFALPFSALPAFFESLIKL